MKEAVYWHPERDGVRCELCPHLCFIPQGQNGYCGVRGNRDGRLYALTFGQVAACAQDLIEKKPLYHFYPGHKTLSLGGIGCNLRCRHCQNWQLSCCDVTNTRCELQPLSPEAAVQLALDNRCQSLVWTYNEPSIWYEYILATAPLAQQAGLKTVLVTAGMIHAHPLRDLLPYIDAYRLDIKGFSDDFYRWLTGVKCLDQILANAVSAYQAGCHVEIVTNVIPGHNDDDEQLRGLARWIVLNLSVSTPWHLTAYFPQHELEVVATPVAALEKGAFIGHQEGLAHIFIGNITGHAAQHSFCPDCRHRLVQREGYTVVENLIVDSCCPNCGGRMQDYCG